MYLILKQGYEGIEELLWGTADRSEAEDKFRSYMKQIDELSCGLEEHLRSLGLSMSKDDYLIWDIEMEWLNQEVQKYKSGELEIYTTGDLKKKRYGLLYFDRELRKFVSITKELNL